MHDYAIDIVLSIYIVSLGYVPLPPPWGLQKSQFGELQGIPDYIWAGSPWRLMNCVPGKTTPIFYKGVDRRELNSIQNVGLRMTLA